MAPRRPPQVVAMGGGGFSTEAGATALGRYVLAIAGDEPAAC